MLIAVKSRGTEADSENGLDETSMANENDFREGHLRPWQLRGCLV